MTEALGRALTDVPEAAAPALGQVERAIAATLEHHAHVRLMPAAGRSGLIPISWSAVDEGLPIAYEVLEKGVPVLASRRRAGGHGRTTWWRRPRRTSSTAW